jgi:hypothetical protein
MHSIAVVCRLGTSRLTEKHEMPKMFLMLRSADRSGRAVYGTNCLLPLQR